MSEETDTEILEKVPLLKACIDYILKKIETIIVTLVISGTVGGCNHYTNSMTPSG